MSMGSTERVEEEAAEWLVRRDGAQWSATDEVKLQQWLDESIENSVAFIRLEVGWEQVKRLKALGTGVAKDIVPSPGQWQISPFFDQAKSGQVSSSESAGVSRSRALRWHWLATAASVLAAIGATSYFLSIR